MDSFHLFLLTQFCIAIPAATGFTLLYVQARLLHFGYALWLGLGAYALWGLLNFLPAPGTAAMLGALADSGLGSGFGAVVGLFLLGAAAVLLVAAVALITAPLMARSTGMVFAMLSLAIGELVHVLAQSQTAWFGGEAGISMTRPDALSPPALLAATAVLALATVWAYRRFLHSRTALHVMACSDHTVRYQILGQSVLQVRCLVITAAAALAAVSGSLQFILLERSSDAAFSLDKSYAWVLYGVLSTLVLPARYSTHTRALWLVPPLSALLFVLGQYGLPRYTSASGLILGLVFVLAVLQHCRRTALTPAHA